MKFRSNRKSYEKRRRLPQGEKTRNPKVLVGSLAAIVISLVVLAVVVVIGIVGFSTDNSKETAAKSDTNAPFHVWFIAESKEIHNGTGVSDMGGNYTVTDGVSYLPLDGIVTALSGTLKYNEDTGVCKIRDIGKWVKLTVDSDVMRVSLFRKVTLAGKVYEEDGVVYVPAATFFDAIGYACEYTASSGRLDVFPAGDGEEAKPTASFTTDKDTYQVGEKIVYTTENASPEGYEIVDEKWDNYDDWYFESGEVNVGYAVKDYKGNWSKTYSKTLTIEGEYTAAERVPVLSYFYLAKNDSDVYQTKTERTQTVTTADATGKVLSTKTTTKAANYDDYTDKTETKTTTDSDGNTVKTTTKYTQKKTEGKYYDNPYVIKLSQFKKEMAALDDEGYTTLTVSEYLDYQDSGVMPPAKSVILLFVNGYETSYTLAYPVLQEYGMKANIVPEVKAVADRSALVKAVDNGEEGAEDSLATFDEGTSFPLVTFGQLTEMKDSGTFEVGCISYDGNRWGANAPVLAEPAYLEDQGREENAEEYGARVKKDVTAAITTLCDNLGEETRPFFVYPFGTTSDMLTAAVKDAGFSCAFLKDDGYIYGDSDLFALHRMNITQSISNWDFSHSILK
ncbi:MAG TPA: polysaccharide deacetylase family protein [Clostridiales bacterium]|nr:polysaccharide deacetylase family protein [Clostridiales bacterium]